ncbi:MAG: formylglycine-generating enzyme family protein [Nitrospina sp.]|jgi:formylglycine-generating enzyme|nr:formylglycine-generating enzyme family protein [Nitrospina sp.]MBT3508192.1 formylglycine-generating enzyme family protein [Nitrospina sp.]MBT3874829.1 formylglycine-generating enzyme family protein [Nitrospina sp.]MBT4048009.1 formylglycine-generating enzyme family protein [Nitrospina sp.]MBT4555968.1 formylglycine-generating enzyme family protein [Nitrospina sp.]
MNLPAKYNFVLSCLVLWKVFNPGIVHGADISNMVYIGESDAIKTGKNVNGFYMDRYEVTQADYLKVMQSNPSFFQGMNRPVEKVTWNQAAAYCNKVGKRLPTEQEWEKAIRAGTTSLYFWGEDQPDHYAWHKGNADKKTHDVGKKMPNPWGLYDMAGNVWEWTQSDHERSGKVARGGSWRNGVGSLKSSHRISSLPIHKFHYVGFRCVVSE